MAGREAEPLESKPVEKDEETAETTSPAHQVFEDALYRCAKVLKDAGESLPMANDKCKYHVVLVIYHMPITLMPLHKCNVIHHMTPQVYAKLISFLELVFLCRYCRSWERN